MTETRLTRLLAGFMIICGPAYGSMPCAGLIVQDVVMPAYAPIARAAHVEGVVSFPVSIDTNRQAQLGKPSGPHLLAISAEPFLAARRYSWESNSPSLPCEYTAEIEYRIIPGESDEFNSFARVTTLGAGHTLIEVQAIKPSCQDCSDFRCSLEPTIDQPPPKFPMIAVAAHVEGDLSAVIHVDKTGRVQTVDQMTGPEMLKAPARDYLMTLAATPPVKGYGCEANVFLSYHLTPGACEIGPTTVTRADSTHILVETNSLMTCDPATTITKGHKR